MRDPNKLATDEEFESFLVSASQRDLSLQGLAMIATLEDVEGAIRSAEWLRMSRVLTRWLEADQNRPPKATAELRIAIRAIAIIHEAEAKLIDLAREQHGN